jgi:O-antigen ligase
VESATLASPRSLPLVLRRSLALDAICAWLLPAVLVVYLGVRQGGYDTVISSQVAIAAWWLIALLAGLGLARAHLRRSGWIGFGLLCAYAGWTTLSLTWTESSGATMVDVSQMLLYVALFALVLLLRGRDSVRLMLSGLACGIVAIAVIALLSRLRFEWFAVPSVDQSLPQSTRRLSYPIDYWNALAALMAIGIPLLLYCATGARTLAGRAAAGAALPLLALCAFLTASRGGIIEIACGIVLFVLLAPDRLPKLATIALAGAGSALLVEAANQRPELRNGARTALAAHQGNELIAITIAVVAGVGLLSAALVLIERHVQRPRQLRITRRQLTVASAAGLVAAIAIFFAAGGGGLAQRKWDQFKSTSAGFSTKNGNAFQRLQSTSGEGRYQYWQVAARTAARKPLTGSGANTFQFEWLRHGVAAGGFVVDAHSLYLQALGDLGYPGLVLIALFMLWLIGCGIRRVIASREPAERLAVAAATAAAFAFAFSAAIDWIWFIPVLPFSLFVCAAAIFARRPGEQPPAPRRRLALAARVLAVAVSLAAIVVVALPMAATEQLRASQALVPAGRTVARAQLAAALSHAEEAASLEPYAPAGYLQEALVEEQAGDLTLALADAREALAREPVNWSIWIVLSRLEARTGHARAALADYDHARWLYPFNPLFAQ